jgi:hypothetical protein
MHFPHERRLLLDLWGRYLSCRERHFLTAERSGKEDKIRGRGDLLDGGRIGLLLRAW